MVYFAMSALLKATSPLIGYEESHSAAAPTGWADEADTKTINAWKELAKKKETDLKSEFWEVYEKQYLEIMGKVRLIFYVLLMVAVYLILFFVLDMSTEAGYPNPYGSRPNRCYHPSSRTPPTSLSGLPYLPANPYFLQPRLAFGS